MFKYQTSNTCTVDFEVQWFRRGGFDIQSSMFKVEISTSNTGSVKISKFSDVQNLHSLRVVVMNVKMYNDSDSGLFLGAFDLIGCGTIFNTASGKQRFICVDQQPPLINNVLFLI
jgi:hypothetical protein